MGRRATNTVAATTEAIKKKIKDVGAKRREFRVVGHPGLVLMTQTRGVGVFYLFYSPKDGSKTRKFRIGEFPAVTLADASRSALEARASIEGGGDPFRERTTQKASMTFQEMAEKFVAESPSLSKNTRSVYLACLKKDAFPDFGSKAASMVTTSDVLAVCQRIKARNKIVQAQRTKTTIGGAYKWGMNEGYVRVNPAKDVPKQQIVKSVRTRTPSDDEIKALWKALDGEDTSRVSTAIKLIIRLAIITGQRRTEVAGARLSEIVGDTWVIDADVAKAGRIIQEGRMKNGSEQRLYLSSQASKLFEEARKTCAVGDYFFPASKEKTRLPHIHGDSVTQAMRRLCDAADIDDLSIHDMRRAIGNFLKDGGYGREVRDLVLHHKDTSVDGTHYSNTARMEKQCKKAWQAWGSYVAQIVQ